MNNKTPGPGDESTWSVYSGHANDPRKPIEDAKDELHELIHQAKDRIYHAQRYAQREDYLSAVKQLERLKKLLDENL